jgi:hypothetical protein
MSALSDKDFAERVLEVAQPREGSFEPVAYYDPDGDCVEFFAKPDPFYAERIDKWVTVYYSHETHEIVGSLVKGVSALLQKIKDRCPGFGISVRDGRVRVDHLFLANLWCQEPGQEVPVAQYEKLRQLTDVAAGAPTEADLQPA